MNLRATSAEPNAPPRGAALKFAYPSGSRPLEGYTIKRGVGRGGFGEVYYAASDAGKEVALKLIRRNLDVELRGVTQCLNLKHPNLLDLYDIRQDELGDSWVVMEYVAGDCLEDVVSRHPNGLPRDEALAWFHGIAAGVAYLHDRGIVHRDLKPGNIFCDEGLVKIGDYGLSKFISASRRSGQTESVGTVHYMAPEIGNGRYGKEIDIYALGIILYELLTGRVPFDGESVGEVLMKHLTAEPDLTGLEDPYRTAIARTLTKDPEQRLRAVAELLALLPAANKVPSTSAPTAFASAMPGLGGAGAPAPPVSPPRGIELAAAELVDEEPIWSAARDGWRQFNQAWTSGRINTPAKVGLILVFAMVLVGLNFGLIPIVAVGAIGYAGYFLVRSLLLANQRPVRPTINQPAAPRAPPARPAPPIPRAAAADDLGPPTSPFAGGRTPVVEIRRRRNRRLAQTLPALPAMSPREHVQELSGSLLLSAAVAAAVTVIMVILRGQPPRPEQFAWLLLVSTAGAWMIQIPSRAWAGTEGDAMLRRFVLLVAGLFLGAGAWMSHEFLLAELGYEWRMPDPVAQRTSYLNLYDAQGQPSWMAYSAYFGFLFLLVRWWQQADPLRSARLSVWTTAVTIFWAWLLNFFWPFPQPWGIMVAATMSLAVQLASPWHNPRRRSNVNS